MNDTISIETNNFQIDFRHILLFVALVAMACLLGVYLSSKPVLENKTLPIEDVKVIAEEIYNSGTIEALAKLQLDAAVTKKMAAEIEGILSKTTDYQGYEVYFLTVIEPGVYPILGYGNALLGTTYLNSNEVWKVGMTKNGLSGRYPSEVYVNNKILDVKLTGKDLNYNKIFSGNYIHALVLEKVMIYTYPLWSGHPELIKPPGCKIFK